MPCGGIGTGCGLKARWRCLLLQKLLKLSLCHASPAPLPLEWPLGALHGMVLGIATGQATKIHPRPVMESWTPICSSRQKVAGQPKAGDAEHRQLSVAHGRPAGAGSHCQCVQGSEQGRVRPWPGSAQRTTTPLHPESS